LISSKIQTGPKLGQSRKIFIEVQLCQVSGPTDRQQAPRALGEPLGVPRQQEGCLITFGCPVIGAVKDLGKSVVVDDLNEAVMEKSSS
jgi:hypothetical protein